ncbi:MAG: hypothetical protein F7C36_00410 [Desulfurococcales archaeon]|nr:hypothetical protein [Desulfurococcales archaeon]
MGGTPTPITEWKEPKQRLKGNLAKLLAREMYEYDSSSIVVIFGKTGAGKSQYAMKIAYQFLGDWSQVLSWMVFTPFDFSELIDYLDQNDKWTPIIIWDDAGPWLELLKRNSWHPLAIGIRGSFETARLRVGAVILTMTTDRSLPRGIAYDGYIYKYRAKMVKWGHQVNGHAKSVARIQVRVERRNEWGRFYWEEQYRDHVTLNTPIYEEYEALRKKYLSLYNKLIKASRVLRPNQLLDYIAREWEKMRDEGKI